MPIMPIDDVVIGERFRKDMGDLNELATSIAEQGLLQPIGIDEEDNLVFGERRLLACRDILKWTEIEVIVVNVTSIVEGEFAENEVRKQFTASERVAIADAVMKRKQQGKATPELVGARRQGEKARKTEDLAAKKAGFGSARTMRRVKAVHDSGDQELVQALDEGRITPTDAEKVIKDRLPPKDKSKTTKRLDALIKFGETHLVEAVQAGEITANDAYENIYLPSIRPKPKKLVPIEEYVRKLIRELSKIVRRGKMDSVVEHGDFLSEWQRRDVAMTLRSMAAQMVKQADQLYPDVEILEEDNLSA